MNKETDNAADNAAKKDFAEKRVPSRTLSWLLWISAGIFTGIEVCLIASVLKQTLLVAEAFLIISFPINVFLFFWSWKSWPKIWGVLEKE